MQTDQEQQQPPQGDAQKETEEKTPPENEEMEVSCSVFVQRLVSFNSSRTSMQPSAWGCSSFYVLGLE